MTMRVAGEYPSPPDQRTRNEAAHVAPAMSFERALIAAAASHQAPIAFDEAGVLGARRNEGEGTHDAAHKTARGTAPTDNSASNAPLNQDPQVRTRAVETPPPAQAARREAPNQRLIAASQGRRAAALNSHCTAAQSEAAVQSTVKAVVANAAGAPRPDGRNTLTLALTTLLTCANVVLVAVHAADGEIFVFARAGRMSEPDRARLRQGVAHLLAEHGYANAKITIELGTETSDG